MLNPPGWVGVKTQEEFLASDYAIKKANHNEVMRQLEAKQRRQRNSAENKPQPANGRNT